MQTSIPKKMTRPSEFINRDVVEIKKDINDGNLPKGYKGSKNNMLSYINSCLIAEEYKHPYTDEPREDLIEYLKYIIMYGLSEKVSKKI